MTGSHFGPPGSAVPAGPPEPAGDAAKNFLNLANTPLDAAGAQRVHDAGAELKSLAENGHFAVNEAGFKAYIDACDVFLEGYKERKRDLDLLAQKAKMGSSDYARATANFNVKVAAGDEHSLIPNLDLMRDGVERAREAMTIARANYRETEQAHKIAFSNLSKDLNNT